MSRIRREARALRAPLQKAPAGRDPTADIATASRRVNVISDVVLRPARAENSNLARLEWAVAHADELFPEPPRRRLPRGLPELIPIREEPVPSRAEGPVNRPPPAPPLTLESPVGMLGDDSPVREIFIDLTQSPPSAATQAPPSAAAQSPPTAAVQSTPSAVAESLPMDVSEDGPSQPTDWEAIAEQVAATPNARDWPEALVAALRSLRPPGYPAGRRCRRHLVTRDGRRVHVTLPR